MDYHHSERGWALFQLRMDGCIPPSAHSSIHSAPSTGHIPSSMRSINGTGILPSIHKLNSQSRSVPFSTMRHRVREVVRESVQSSSHRSSSQKSSHNFNITP